MLLAFLAVASFLTMTVWVMLGPLLVELAREFGTSVAVTGQLAAATAITWACTAFLAGPVSDTYGRGRMLLTGLMLMALGTLSSACAWTYASLLACRCLTGVGAAMIPPNCLATVADVLPPDQRGPAMGWLSGATGLGTAFGIPLVALLTEVGGWRCPLMQVAGTLQATATGLLAVSNQLGAVGGASLGGVLLALGSFPLVGLFCLTTTARAAVVIRYKVQRLCPQGQGCQTLQ
jgi:predicted MFS family arabinose efflux permease